MKTELSEAECLNILGLCASDTMETIRERYHYLRATHHPDRKKPKEKPHGEEMFKQATQAYERLIEIRGDRSAFEFSEEKPLEREDRLLGGNDRRRWNFWGRFRRQPGPPPRSSPGTQREWPHLRNVHKWWLRPLGYRENLPEDRRPPYDFRLPKEDSKKLTQFATEFAKRAKQKGLGDQLYWVAEAEQNEKVCYLRFLKPIIGDVCAYVNVVLAKQTNLTYVEFKVDTVLWWRLTEVLQRLQWRLLTVLAWLVFSAIAQSVLPNGTGAGAISMAFLGLFVLGWIAHWDFYVDYGKVDWKSFYPFKLWRARFEIPTLILLVGFFGWRQWGISNGYDPGARAVYLPVLVWLIAYWLWKSVWFVNYPEANLGQQPKPKDVEAYLAAVKTVIQRDPLSR